LRLFELVHTVLSRETFSAFKTNSSCKYPVIKHLQRRLRQKSNSLARGELQLTGFKLETLWGTWSNARWCTFSLMDG